MRIAILSLTFVGWIHMTAAATSVPWPEHPRPDFTRQPWVNLNGTWGFDFDPKDAGVAEEWFAPGKHEFKRPITVPFPWESKLSGIGDTEYKGVAWYAREITMPAGDGWRDRDSWLVVGACDWEAKVWVNGQTAGEHVGGYGPFDVNLSPFAKPGEKAFIVIRAVDHTDPHQPVGKQVRWYTRTSGIWQTAYLEPRGRQYIRTIRAIPDIKSGQIHYDVLLSGPGASKVTLLSPEDAFVSVKVVAPADADSVRVTAKIEKPRLWSPDSPTLYPAVLEIEDAATGKLDRVETYFGLREVSVGKAPGRDYQYIYLNGEPIYLRGALHQSFHPDGIYQYPDDATCRSDYELCNKIGLNFLRIHIKTPTPREMYWADKLGVLIMEDIPNFWEHSDQARKWWQATLEAAIERDYNHPAIFSWCDFNETWGIGDGQYDADRQKWVADMYRLTKKLDPTRLVEDNSPCRYDHVVTDINSWHFYINDYAKARAHIREVVEKTHPGSEFNYIGGNKQTDAPLINSEYGGISAGLGDQDISWCFKYLTNELRLHDKICGYVYTELSDIEWEHNGFVNYDRTPKEYGYDYWHPGLSLSDLNAADFVVIDAPPCIELGPGETHEVPIKLSHWSDHQAESLRLRWRINWFDRFGDRHKGRWQKRSATWKRFAVVDQPAIEVAADGGLGRAAGALLVELLDGDKIIGRNYTNLLIAQTSPPVEVLNEMQVALRFGPGDFTDWQWSGQERPAATGIAADKAFARGAGHIDYRLRLPDGVNPGELESIELLAELSAKAGDEKLAWPARKKDVDYPQTDGTKWPTDVRISMNGIVIHEETLPDDPADARGALSHHAAFHPGSYGYLVRPDAASDLLEKVINAMSPDRHLAIRFEVPADARHTGGLSIFGDELGRYAVKPTCILTFNEPHKLPGDLMSTQ